MYKIGKILNIIQLYFIYRLCILNNKLVYVFYMYFIVYYMYIIIYVIKYILITNILNLMFIQTSYS